MTPEERAPVTQNGEEVDPRLYAHNVFDRWDKHPDAPPYWFRLPSWVQEYATACVDQTTTRIARQSFASPAAGREEVAFARVLEALTPHGETKAAYIGEFSWTQWLPDQNGVEQGYERVVPWDTIKEIMAAIRERAGVDKLDEADALALLAKRPTAEVEI